MSPVIEDPLTKIEVVPCAASVKVTVTSPLFHVCPFQDEEDEGTVTISWRTRQASTLELHSLRAYLDSLAESVISHEELMADLHAEISKLPVTNVKVSSTWYTASMDVAVEQGA